MKTVIENLGLDSKKKELLLGVMPNLGLEKKEIKQLLDENKRHELFVYVVIILFLDSL
jgi:division protein CdvB (Snf7/Vps24/ESCRT-III family)